MPDIFVSNTVEPAPSINPVDHKSNIDSKPGIKGSGFSLAKALSAFLFMPEDVRFETQTAGEVVLLLLRKHWITNMLWIISSVLLLIAPLFLYPLIVYSGLLPSDTPRSYITLVILVWYLATFSYTFVEFLLWYFTVSIITDERIVDIDFSNILNKKYSETRINRIEDVTMRTGGSIRALFDYGDVIVQTAAEQVQFVFEAVPHPERVVRLLNELMDKFEHNNITRP